MCIIRAYDWDVEGAFPWLHSICLKITSSKTSIQCILKIIEESVVLYNYLIEEHDNVPEDWRDDSDISDVDKALSDDDELDNVVSQLCPNDHRCLQLKNFLLEKYVYT